MSTLPAGFTPVFYAQHPDEELLITALETSSPVVSIRRNPRKTARNFAGTEKVSWCTQGLYLPERPSFTFDPDFHSGCYYVQEASSMFLEQAIKALTFQGGSRRVLDLCAAPGGKSTHLLSLLNDDDLVVSNEIIKTRTPILGDNINRWGNANSFVSQNDPKDFVRLAGYFDLIVADAPCSGSGMFRKDEKAIDEWSPQLVDLCQKRQRRILADVLPALKQDGYLIYSTCSFSDEENEDIADWLTGEFDLESIRIPLETEWNITETESHIHKAYGYRFYPHKLRGEGFFLAAFRKKEGENSPLKTNRSKEKPAKAPDQIYDWLINDTYVLKAHRDDWYALHPQHAADWDILRQHLHLYKSGVKTGRFAGKDFLPDYELAQSLIISPEIAGAELDEETAIRYLRKENIGVKTAPGWTLARFGGNGLGWMKVLPNRVNNYYPKEIRILKPVPEY
ncbi:MAG: hypothetical protein INR69_07025 [Mucilaginibacter polytrichastri]|nr:hypothetical protein [Mucilaginibacter polytrichastri]